MTILLIAALLIYLVGAIRSKDPVNALIALVGIVVWALVMLRVIPTPEVLR